jgi:TPR repeat protein
MANSARRILWPVLIWCLYYAPAAGQEYWNYKTAYDAYDAGEFQLAADIYKRLAKKGDARSQNDLGFLYSVGQGVPQDFKTAALWFHKAAEQGHAPALMHLASLYDAGRGVRQSAIEAHKFYSLAGFLGEKANRRRIALSRRNDVASRLTADQLTTSRKRACRWWRTHHIQIIKNNRPSPRELPDCTAD